MTNWFVWKVRKECQEEVLEISVLLLGMLNGNYNPLGHAKFLTGSTKSLVSFPVLSFSPKRKVSTFLLLFPFSLILFLFLALCFSSIRTKGNNLLWCVNLSFSSLQTKGFQPGKKWKMLPKGLGWGTTLGETFCYELNIVLLIFQDGS